MGTYSIGIGQVKYGQEAKINPIHLWKLNFV
jgi:hypothetical protein